MMKPFPSTGTGKSSSRSRYGEQAGEVTWSQHPSPQADIIKWQSENTEKHKEDVLARYRPVRASAGGGSGECNSVDIARCTKDEELGVGSVEKAKTVVDGTGDPVGDELRRVVPASSDHRRW